MSIMRNVVSGMQKVIKIPSNIKAKLELEKVMQKVVHVHYLCTTPRVARAFVPLGSAHKVVHAVVHT